MMDSYKQGLPEMGDRVFAESPFAMFVAFYRSDLQMVGVRVKK